MNKTSLLKRKEDLLKDIELYQQKIHEITATLNALSGAIQDIDYWLLQIETEETNETEAVK